MGGRAQTRDQGPRNVQCDDVRIRGSDVKSHSARGNGERSADFGLHGKVTPTSCRYNEHPPYITNVNRAFLIKQRYWPVKSGTASLRVNEYTA
jgi:hypothetical protein